jgi:hypothetical protein
VKAQVPSLGSGAYQGLAERLQRCQRPGEHGECDDLVKVMANALPVGAVDPVDISNG